MATAVADLQEVRRLVERADVEVAQIRSENQQLRDELRRALSREAVAGWLHKERSPADAARAKLREQTQRLADEAQALRAWLRPKADLQGLEEEVGRMRDLQAQPEEAWLAGDMLPEAGADPARAVPSPGREGERSGMLLAEVSFEMLVTIGEAELAEEKKVLQRRVRALRRRLERSAGQQQQQPPCEAAARTSNSTLGMRHRRQLRQIDTIAGRLHEEFRRRASASGPALPWMDHAPPAAGAAGEPAALAEQPTAATGGATAAAPPVRLDASRRDQRCRQLEGRVKALSRRFLLVRDMK